MLPGDDHYPSVFSHLPTPNMVEHQQHHHHHHHLDPSSIAVPQLDSLAHSSPYSALAYHQSRQVLPNGKAFAKPQRLPYPTVPMGSRSQREAPAEHAGRNGATSGPVRRRISRACDQCNQLRTKCDGRQSCAHCIEFGLTCEYIRERKKRGKASRKDIAQQQVAAAAAKKTEQKPDSPGAQSADVKAGDSAGPVSSHLSDGQPTQPSSTASLMATKPELASSTVVKTRNTSTGIVEAAPKLKIASTQPTQTSQHHTRGQSMASIADYTPIDDPRSSAYQSTLPMMQSSMHPIVASHGLDYSDNAYSMISPLSAHTQLSSNAFRIQGSPADMKHVTPSPVFSSSEWTIPSPYPMMFQAVSSPNSAQTLRCPVLQPLVPHLANLMPLSLACDLLELYFQSSSPVLMQPVSPYVLGHVFRKHSFLRHSNPRICSPGLLASMLWIGCLTSDSPLLSSSPTVRSQLSERLMNLTISLLKPLVHQAHDGLNGRTPRFSESCMGSNIAPNHFSMPVQEIEPGFSAGSVTSGAVDDVATYMNLAIVISASEYKAASLRWWNAAWSLAKELKLGQEVPATPPPELNNEEELKGIVSSTEEEREERRRIWWLLYTVDRHLALCYNQPLSLLDIECSGLLQPLDDSVWQNGDFFKDSAQVFSDSKPRRKGPTHKCTGLSVFGFFLPCMSILGDIFSLRYVQSHPRLGTTDWVNHASSIGQHILQFEQSLRDVRCCAWNEARVGSRETTSHEPTFHQPTSINVPRAQEKMKHITMAGAYGEYMVHILQILLYGKWDPICLLEDRDFWSSSQAFVTATGHAVSAANALSSILELDPGFELMPFFFGIYLLQGSFFFLLIASKTQNVGNTSIAHACQVFFMSLEACNTTVNGEYKRNYLRAIYSAMQRIRGQKADAPALMQPFYEEMLSLCRWTGDGTGIAL